MQGIEIDFEVYKALTARRASEGDSLNDVLRRLLGFGQGGAVIKRHFDFSQGRVPAAAPASGQNDKNDWFYKGIRFPAGTDFRARYRGQLHHAKIEQGAMALNGKRVQSPSDAAREITGNNVNGWRFWQCRLPGEAGWRRLDSLRRDS
ncbi:MAG TPA: DUF2924 domain-containing protein [Stellaceae bacterium]|nr:DUF2924 domain-containing protein [Stellaceae bacterium]